MGKEDQVDNVDSWVTYFQTLTIRFGSVYQFWSPSSFHLPYTQEGWKACIVGAHPLEKKKTSAIIATHWRGIHVHIILMVCDGGLYKLTIGCHASLRIPRGQKSSLPASPGFWMKEEIRRVSLRDGR